MEIDFNKRTQINIDTSQRLFQRYFGFLVKDLQSLRYNYETVDLIKNGILNGHD